MEDIKIIDLFFDRSELSIAETAKKYGRLCKRIANNILRNDEDSEECVNTAYLKLWNAIPPEKPENFSAYLGKIVKNTALSAYAKRTAKKRDSSLSVVLSELEQCLSTTDDDKRDSAEITEAINQFLFELDEKNRNLFICRYWHSESIKQLAVTFGFSETNVKQKLFVLRTKLKKHLEDKGVEI